MTTLSFDIPPRAVAFSTTPAGFRLALKRNCSISPRGLLLAFAARTARSALAAELGNRLQR